MKKRLTALALCAVLMLLPVLPARAEESVYFVAAGGNVLPLSDATMPFWQGGYLYVSSTIFTGMVWNSLGVAHVAANDRQPLILYGGGDKSLLFDPTKSYAQDAAGTIYYPGGVAKNGTVFVPISLVAKFFDLQYSLIDQVEHGSLVWLRRSGFGLSETDFAKAATYPMESCYERYLQDKAPKPADLPAAIEPEPQIEIKGKHIYLTFQADALSGAIAEVLERSGLQGTFFCTEEFIRTQGDLVRRLCAAGHSLALMTEGGEDAADRLRQGNEALWRACCAKTRMAYVSGADEETLRTLTAEGWCCFTPDLDRTGYGLRSTANAEALLQKISARRGSVTVWLGQSANTVGVRAFLTAAERGENQCLPLTETV